MKVVIDGPTGVLGHALIEECLKNGDEVLAICRSDSEKIKSLPISPQLYIYKLDLCNYKSQIEYFSNDNKKNVKDIKLDYDVFYHFAWEGTNKKDRDNFCIQNKNIEYSLDSVRLAKALGCKTYIGAGSQAEFGNISGVVSTKTLVNPITEYGKAKLKAGIETKKLCYDLNMKHIWTRVLSVYGPYNGDDSLIISSLVKMMLKEKISFTPGEQVWDYLYSSDAANAFRLLGEKGNDGKTYIVGSGKTKTIKEFIKIMAQLTDYNDLSGIGDLSYSDGQIMYLKADISELNQDTGFVPLVEFEEGIKHTINYIKNTCLKG